MKRKESIQKWRKEIMETKWHDLKHDTDDSGWYDMPTFGKVPWKRLVELLSLLCSYKCVLWQKVPTWKITPDGEVVKWVRKRTDRYGKTEYYTTNPSHDWVLNSMEALYRIKGNAHEAVAALPKNYDEYCERFRPDYPSPHHVTGDDAPLYSVGF